MSVIHIGRGFGFLVIVSFFGCYWEVESIVNSRFGHRYAGSEHLWTVGISTLCAAVLCLIAGWFFYDRDTLVETDPFTQEEVLIRTHTYFYIPILWWGVIFAAVGLSLVLYDFGEFRRTALGGQKIDSAKVVADQSTQHVDGRALAPPQTATNSAPATARSIPNDGSRQTAGQLTEPTLTHVTQQGRDTYATLLVRPEWMAEERIIHVPIGDSRAIRIQLTHAMAEGSRLRLKGKSGLLAASSHDNGDLYLSVQFPK